LREQGNRGSESLSVLGGDSAMASVQQRAGAIVVSRREVTRPARS
jgi:hypothetical protein